MKIAKKITKSCWGFSYIRDSEVPLTESLEVRSAIQGAGEFGKMIAELLWL